jgi:uncharacterized repeat protein (TIGR01451 family)
LLIPEFAQRVPDARLRLGQDSVFVWNFTPLTVGAQTAITFDVSVPALTDTIPLFSRSLVTAVGDTFPANNFSSATVIALPAITPPAAFDLAHTQTATPGTVRAGEKFTYQLNIANNGPNASGTFTLSDTISALLIPEFAQRVPDARLRLGQDSVFVWNFTPLTVGAQTAITFGVNVPATLPSTPLPLHSRSLVTATGDTFLTNNFAMTTVNAIAAAGGPTDADCYLDRNVFSPSREPTLGINWGLRVSSIVRLNVYDLTGTHIVELSNQQYNAGQQRYEWNGVTKTGGKAGSGFYVVTIEAENYRCFLKFFAVQ